jgi:hypothetical protein
MTLAAAGMLLLSACGGGDGGGADLNENEQAQADAIAEAMTSGAGSDAVFDAEDAACYGASVVDAIGVDRLEELGLGVAELEAGATPDQADLSDDDIEAMTRAMIDCIDFRAMLVDEFVAGGMTQEAAGCIADGLDDELLVSIAKTQIAEGSTAGIDDEVTASMFGIMAECIGADIGGG